MFNSSVISSVFFSRVLSGRDFAARVTAPEYLILEYTVEDKSILTRIL